MIFDIENELVGFANAKCSEDPHQIYDESVMIEAGQRYALDPSHIESANIECNHGS